MGCGIVSKIPENGKLLAYVDHEGQVRGSVTEFVEAHGGMVKGILEDVSANFESHGVNIKVTPIKKGLTVVQHKHKYPHLSILMKGKVWLETDSYRCQMVAGQTTTIEAGIYHAVTALEDSVWLCVHTHADEVK